MSDTAPPAAGWYADPENPAGERWWNGSSWSDHRRGGPSLTSPVPPPSTGFSYGTGVAQAGRPDPYAAPAPYAPTAYSPAPYGAPAPGSGTNGLALAGLIVSTAGWLVVPLLAGIAGIILSGFGLAQARQREAAGNPNSGRSLAMAGLIVGIVVTAISIIVAVAYFGFLFSMMSSSSF